MKRVAQSVLIAVWIFGGPSIAAMIGVASKTGIVQEAPQPPPVSPEERIKPLIVMVKAQFMDEERFGAGIIFGMGNDRIYIATANHVVRKGQQEAQILRVEFKWLPGEPIEARLLERADRDLDLAVLAVADLARLGKSLKSLALDQLGDPNSLRRGDKVYPIGSPRGRKPNIDVEPDKVSENSDSSSSISFRSFSIQPGHSGGALLNEKLEIVGMIRADDPPEGVAVNIQRILDKLREWGFQVNLRRKEARKDDSVLTSRKNDIYNLREVDVSDTRIQITVDYIYIGDQGETVIMQATPLLSDEMLFPDPFGHTVPPPITAGSGSCTVEIERQIRDLETYTNTKVKVCMYRSKQPGITEVFLCKVFPVHKVWRVDASLKERYPSPDIGGFSAMDLSDTEMTFSVGMRYYGVQLSDKLYLKGCALLDDGRIVPGTACNFAPIVHAYSIQMNIQRLEHLSDRKIYTSSIVEVCLATGKENEPPMDFFCKKFPFNKTWR